MTSLHDQSAHVNTGSYFDRFEVRGGDEIIGVSQLQIELFVVVSESSFVFARSRWTGNLILHPKPVSLSLIARFCTLSADATSLTRVSMPDRRPFVRLPTDVYPVNYALCLKPDLIDFTFEGRLEAQVEVGLLLMHWERKP